MSTTKKDDYYHVGLTDDEVLQSREKNGVPMSRAGLRDPTRFFIEIAPPGTEFSIDIFREYDSISTIERKGQAFSIKTGGKKT